jgi:L-threonylcarbamoyladenylate synthase
MMNDDRQMPLRPAIFLDRDGTIIKDCGTLTNPDDISFLPDTIEALLKLQQQFKLFIVTNQRCIADGIATEAEVKRVNDTLVTQLKQAGVDIIATYVCPHRRDDNCDCIKPKPLFLEKAARDHNINLLRSFAIGDHPHDVEFAWNAGLFGVYVMTGHGRRHLNQLHRDAIIAIDLKDAVSLILNGLVGNIKDYAVPRAATIIRNGGLVAFPTETVYGLGADAFNIAAVKKIFEAKERPYFNPLIIHIAELAQIDDLVSELPALARQLAEAFWPGPLTLILPKSTKVPDIITAGLDSVGIRIPAHGTALRLLNATGRPIAAPSANKFGMISPTTADHVMTQLSNDIDMVLDSDIPCEVGIESTIVSFANEQPEILRLGGISIEEIQQYIGNITVKIQSESLVTQTAPEAPGMLKQHYAPKTPMLYCHQYMLNNNQLRVGKISLTDYGANAGYAVCKILSSTGNLEEAAQNLYAVMQEFDTMNLDLIIAEPMPDIGIGTAINDRLQRAASANNLNEQGLIK